MALQNKTSNTVQFRFQFFWFLSYGQTDEGTIKVTKTSVENVHPSKSEKSSEESQTFMCDHESWKWQNKTCEPQILVNSIHA